MRRDYFTLEVGNVDWVDDGGTPEKPSVTIDFDGPSTDLKSRLTDADGRLLSGGETDVVMRLQTPLDDPEARGVVSVTNRMTGEYILELNQTAADVTRFIRAARRYGERADDPEGHYEITLLVEGREIVTYQKSTFLIYNRDGNLLRQHSLIPGNVEL